MDFEQALAELNQEIETNPLDHEPIVERGNLYAEAGEYEQAIGDYTSALALAPQEALVWDNRGVAHLYQLDYYAALADFSQALTLDPTYIYALANRAYVYAVLEKSEWALDNARSALLLDPNFAPAYDVIGQALAQQNRLEESLHALNQAEQLDAGCVQVPFHQAMVLQRLGRPTEAKTAFIRYLSMNDDQQNAAVRRQTAQAMLVALASRMT